MKENYDSKGTKNTSCEVGDTVLLCNLSPGSNKLDFRWSGPWTVVRKLNDSNYAIILVKKNRL